MQRGAVGFISGVVGGLIKLLLDQLALAVGISKVNTVAGFASIFSTQGSPWGIWLVYVILSGLVGWAVARLVSRQFIESYLTAGIIIGAVIWVAMNIVFVITNVTVPTWSMGLSSLITNLVTHCVLGIVVTYSLLRYGLEDEPGKLVVQ